MFNILIVDEDKPNSDKIIEILSKNKEYKFICASSVEGAVEILNPKPPKAADPKAEAVPKPVESFEGPCHLMLLDVLKVGPVPAVWLAEFRELMAGSPSQNVPICLMSYDKDPDNFRKFMIPGVVDLLVKPVLGAVLEGNIQFLALGDQAPPLPLFPIKGSVELMFPVQIETISEFDLKVRINRAIPATEIKEFCGSIFNWTPDKRVIARCNAAVEDKEDKGNFVHVFSFVGVLPGVTKAIRVWLKNEYTRKKQLEGA